MMCRRPHIKNGATFGCGQCMPCRINKRRTWAHRIMLEALVSSSASFLTMTYDDEHLPDGGSLELRDVQLYWKSLRKAGFSFRYLSVGSMVISPSGHTITLLCSECHRVIVTLEAPMPVAIVYSLDGYGDAATSIGERSHLPLRTT